LFRECLEGFRRGHEPRRRLLASLIVCSTALILTVISRHTLRSDEHWRIHERYFMVVIPAVIVLFATSSVPGSTSRLLNGITLVVYFLSIVAVAFFLWFVAPIFRYVVTTDSPSLSGELLALHRKDLPALLVGFFFASAIAASVLQALSAWRSALAVWAVGAFLVCLNIGWYGAHDIIVNQGTKGDRSIARKINRRIPAGDKLVVLLDGLDSRTASNAEFMNPGAQVYLGPPQPAWNSRQLKIGPGGLVLPPYPQDEAWLLSSNKWKFNKPAEKTFDTCELYKIGGEPGLCLLGARPKEEVASNDHKTKIRFSYL
jgi:hypothetical protein